MAEAKGKTLSFYKVKYCGSLVNPSSYPCSPIMNTLSASFPKQAFSQAGVCLCSSRCSFLSEPISAEPSHLQAGDTSCFCLLVGCLRRPCICIKLLSGGMGSHKFKHKACWVSAPASPGGPGLIGMQMQHLHKAI